MQENTMEFDPVSVENLDSMDMDVSLICKIIGISMCDSECEPKADPTLYYKR